jgi:hypothetical protein
MAAPPQTDTHYESLHAQGLREAPMELVARLERSGPARFSDLWPAVLEAHHVTKVELAQLAWDLVKAGRIEIQNAKPRERTVHAAHVLIAKKGGS